MPVMNCFALSVVVSCALFYTKMCDRGSRDDSSELDFTTNGELIEKL